MTDWNEIVRAHGPGVWRTAYRLLARDADAADCFQNAFVSAVELVATSPVRNWAALLRRLATARALELLRARYRGAARASELGDELPADPGAPDPIAAAMEGELADALRAALAGIDSRQAEVFCLVALEGFPNTRAAELLDTTPNNVAVLLHRARAALRQRLRAFDPAAPGGSP